MNSLFNLPNPINLFLILVLSGSALFVVVMMTSYVKTVIIMYILRNALGLQAAPPSFALNGIAILITCFIMAPIFVNAINVAGTINVEKDPRLLVSQFYPVYEPFKNFMQKHSSEKDRQHFQESANKIWSKIGYSNNKNIFADTEINSEILGSDSPLILVVSFMTGELSRAFQSGFLLFLPFLVVDIVVAAVLSSLGMQMVQPTTISLPLKLTLFVQSDGWRLLIDGLINSYS